MRKVQRVRRVSRTAAMLVSLGLTLATAVTASADALVQIQMSGMSLQYDGTSLYDGNTAAQKNSARDGSPSQSDALITVSFILNPGPGEVVLGTLTSDVHLDLFLSDVLNIPIAGGSATSGPGFIDVLTNSGCSDDCWGLALDVTGATVSYLPDGMEIQGAGDVVGIFAQNLPFGVHVGQDVTWGFSSRITGYTDDGTYFTSFLASGTGEIAGAPAPEPGSLFLLGSGLVGLGVYLRRQRSR